MRTGEEVSIGGFEWQSTVRRHASFCSQARRHRPLFSQRAPLQSSLLSGLHRPIPQVHKAIPAISTNCSALDGSSLSLNHCLFFPFSPLIPLQSLFFRLSFLIMTSLVASSSSVSSLHSASALSFHTASSPPSPKPLATSSASSSQVSFSQADEG
jgi:hypothetical protein